jgi:ABC-type uncharacterized transport system auxiliary subunit
MKTKSTTAAILAALCATLLLAGCLSLTKRYPEKHYYILEAPRPGEARAGGEKDVLEIQRFRVSPPYDRKGFVYRREDARCDFDFYNEFFVEPDSLLTEQARRWISKAGLFANVIDSAGNARAGYVLEGRVNSLYVDYTPTPAPQSVLSIQFFLSRESPEESGIIFHKDYRRSIAVKSGTPDALIHGWDQALEGILTDFEADLRGLHLESKG